MLRALPWYEGPRAEQIGAAAKAAEAELVGAARRDAVPAQPRLDDTVVLDDVVRP
ncbi:hypothetical protein [Motilibacter deserti]|uniref:Uncharacterized protein n=1 Tax=Motilibacter deserti TaxID=2714956 RepID=A0ABX0GZ04_9ACTN|nr:hypothetical protein [Motilibacter deserti]NHC15820.1 hypothetical protein [Motilibacter deserti]